MVFPSLKKRIQSQIKYNTFSDPLSKVIHHSLSPFSYEFKVMHKKISSKSHRFITYSVVTTLAYSTYVLFNVNSDCVFVSKFLPF